MQQSDQLSEVVEDIDTDAADAADDDSSGSGRLGGRFSAKALLVSLVAVAVGVGVGGAIPLVGSITSLAGVAAATFLLGVLGRSWYLETAIAGGVATGIIGLGMLTSVSLPIVLPLIEQFGLAFSGIGVAVGGVLGVTLAVVGHYFGRDLRDGLTREL